jgi:hypothetical protein
MADTSKAPEGVRGDSPYTESRKQGSNWTHDHWEKVKKDDLMWNALKWAEPVPEHKRKVDRFQSEYTDMFLRKADYWTRVERDKENAKQENRQDQSDRWETENRDKYRTFIPSPEGVLLQDNDFDSR